MIQSIGKKKYTQNKVNSQGSAEFSRDEVTGKPKHRSSQVQEGSHHMKNSELVR